MILRLLTGFLFIQTSLAQGTFDPSTCGQTKGCLFAPTGCVPSQDCRISFSYQVQNGQTLQMEISGQPPNPQAGFVAVGFSKDNSMGDDSVSACVSNNGQTTGLLAYTPAKSITVKNSPVQTTIQASATNGNLYCVLRRQLGNTGDAQIFDLNGTYYVLMADGPLDNGIPTYHSNNRWVLPRTDIGRYGTNAFGQTIQRDDPGSQGATSGTQHSTNDKLKIAHGILMVLAWSVFIFTGILFARHFRGHWPNTTMLGVKMWFNFHRTINMIGVGMTIAAFVLIFVANGWQWSGPKANASTAENQAWSSIHSILGLLACVIAWAQPLNAVFRCNPESKARPIFNMIHRFFGFSAWLMAAAATMIAVVHFNGMFSNRDAALGLYIAYIAVAGLTLIVLELIFIRNFFVSRRGVGNEIEMVRVGAGAQGSGRVMLVPEQLIKIQRLQLAILLLYIVCAVGLAVAICVLIGLKPGDLA
ncbi:unnamed protein product, partial [Mesorhabditis belari]|uniref:Ferric-chelate reductase 1 n=1 Tax=Mesorhabditis belari TaxID=2138241 RepID=A0AAF3EM17_9BILA